MGNEARAPEDYIFGVDMLGNVAVVEFNGDHYSNPFSTNRQIALTRLLADVGGRGEVRAIVLTGGEGRYFSAGGDFNEVCQFKGGDDSDRWLEVTLGLFKALLNAKVPIVAAIDGYCIGFGLQLAMSCDYRIASDTAMFSMPEVKNGIACINGTYMLERVVGRTRMQQLVWECGRWSGQEAYQYELVHAVAPAHRLRDDAIAFATKLAGYEPEAVRVTKPVMNAGFSKGLEEIFAQAKASHRITFNKGVAQKYMRALLSKQLQG